MRYRITVPASEKIVKGFDTHIQLFQTAGGELDGFTLIVDSDSKQPAGKRRPLTAAELATFAVAFSAVAAAELSALGAVEIPDEVVTDNTAVPRIR